MEFARTEMTDDGSWIEDEEQIVRLKANYVISAFGSGLKDTDVQKAMEPVKVNNLRIEADEKQNDTIVTADRKKERETERKE